MKTYLTYGFIIAFANLLLATLLFFLGFHSDPAKLSSAQLIGTLVGLLISAVGITLGTKARRAEVPANEPFGYGRALGAGVLISLFAALFTIVTHTLYLTVINPSFTDIMIQHQVTKWEEMGMTSAQIENAENFTRRVMHPGIQAAFAFIGSLIFGIIVSLITSIFVRRPATSMEPPVVS